jgi:ribokinase
MVDVLGVGCHSIDTLCLMDRFPAEDTKMEVESIETQGGGNVATALVAAARLGGSAAFCAAVGDDEFRDDVLGALQDEGINTGGMVVREGKNPRAFIMINRENESRTIVYSRKNVPVYLPRDLEKEMFETARVLLIDFYYPQTSVEAARLAREKGIPVVLDAESVPPLAGEVLKNTTHLIASLVFARKYTGMDVETSGRPAGAAAPESGLRQYRPLVEALAEKTGVSFTCITLGRLGSLALDRDAGYIEQPGFEVPTVDTTGAGDVFHGVFSYALARGKPEAEGMMLGSACAAMKCGSLGGREGIPTLGEVTEFLKTRGELA